MSEIAKRLRLLASELIAISVELEHSGSPQNGTAGERRADGQLLSLRRHKIPDSFDDGALEGRSGRTKKAK